MKNTLALIVVFCVSTLASAQAPERVVLDGEARFQAALKQADKPAVAAFLDDSFTWTNNRLGIRTKQKVLSDITPSLESDANLTARVYGQLAVVTGTHHSSRSNLDAHFVRVWVNDRGWKLLLHQSTDVPTTPPPPPPRPSGNGGEPELSTAGLSEMQKEVVSAFQAVEQASASHDPELLSRYTADEFVRIEGRTGRTATKEQWAGILRAAQGQPSAMPGLNTNLQVRVVGDAAVLTVDYQLARGAAQSHSVRVFVKRDGRWQQVLHQQTPLPAAGIRGAN